MRDQRIQLATVAGAAVALGVLVGCTAIKERHVTERTTRNRPAIVQVHEGYDSFGRKWSEEPVVEARGAPARAPEQVATELKTDVVTLNKRVPDTAALGEEYSSDLILTAREQAGTVIVTETIPEGAEYLRSDPTATRDANLLTWKFASMKKDEVKSIRSYYKASKEGELTSCATVTAVPQTCAATFVGKPALALTKTGPDTALLGAAVTYTNTVSNKGTLPARNVVITDKIPEGLAHSSKEYELTFKVGDLAPNEAKSIPVTLTTTKRGKVCNGSVASAANSGQVTAEACTIVHQPGLAVFKTGDPEQYLNRKAGYIITVTNTGDTTLKGIAVTDTAPEPTTFVSAEGARIDRRTATWMVSELAPGHAKTFKAVLTSQVAGTHRNEVAATVMDIRQFAQAQTVWRGLAALLIEVVDDNDPVQIGETTTYTIRVTNQGTADETNINLTAKFSDLVKPVSAEGLTVDGQTLSVSSIPTLGPKESVTYKITTKGIKAGDARLKVTLSADGLTSPVTEEESTHVY